MTTTTTTTTQSRTRALTAARAIGTVREESERGKNNNDPFRLYSLPFRLTFANEVSHLGIDRWDVAISLYVAGALFFSQLQFIYFF